MAGTGETGRFIEAPRNKLRGISDC